MRLTTKIQVCRTAVLTPRLRCRNLGSLQEAREAAGAVSPEMPAIHLGHPVTGLCHQDGIPGESKHHKH